MTYSHPTGGVLRLQAVLNNRRYRVSEQPTSQQSPGTQRQASSLSANPQSPGSQQQAPESPLLRIAPLPKQSQIDPVKNNTPSSSANGQYPYQPQQQRAQEPVTTNTSGAQSSQPAPLGDIKKQGEENLQTVQALNPNQVNYKEMLKFINEQENKQFKRDTTYSGIARLGAAISGANADYQSWWR